MTFTFAQLKADTSATRVIWLEISGIPYAFSNGAITEANKATLFSDSATTGHTFYTGIQDHDLSFSKSIELLSGKGTTGGFEIKLLDFETAAHLDGFLTWLFGSYRGTIARTRLTADVAKHVGGAGHNWTVADNTVFGAAGPFSNDLYCGLETVKPTSLNVDGVTLDDVARSRYQSPCIAHRADKSELYPEVTDHPTQWHGRIVRLFVTYQDGAGELAMDDGTIASSRSSAHQIVGILRDVSFTHEGVWCLRCDGIDTLLKRQMCKGVPEANLSRRFYVYETVGSGWDNGVLDGTTAPVAKVRQTNALQGVEEWFWIALASGDDYVSPQEFINAFNLAARAPIAITPGATWMGNLTAHLEQGALQFRYQQEAVVASLRTVELQWSNHIMVGHDEEDTFRMYWRQLGVSPDEEQRQWLAEFGAGVSVTTLTTFDLDPSLQLINLSSRNETELSLCEGPNDAGPTDFSVGDWVVVISEAGASLCQVQSTVPANTSINVRLFETETLKKHECPIDKPAKVRKCLFGFAGMTPGENHFLAHPVLSVLLSTGVAGFNHANYDHLPEGVGIEFPHETPSASADTNHSLIDIGSFERFFDESFAYVEDIAEVIYEPTTVGEWIEKRLAFLGGYLVVQNGQIAVQRGLTPLWSRSDHTITEKELQPQRSIVFGDASAVEAVRYSHRWDRHAEQFMLVEEYLRGDAASDVADKTTAFEDKGIRLREGGGYNLAMEVLSEFLDEGWRYNVRVDRALIDIEPGQVVEFSDEGDGDATDDSRLYKGLPNPDGTRGFSSGAGASRMVVLEATASQAEQTTDVSLLRIRRKRSGFSASAWIKSWANAAGKTTLTCDAQVFRPVEDGVDVGAFTAGDKVRIISINPTQAGAVPGIETEEPGLTIESVDTAANTITLTGVLALGWPSPPSAATQLMALVHDEYATANQTDAAKEWCHVGDAGVIDGTTDEAYEW